MTTTQTFHRLRAPAATAAAALLVVGLTTDVGARSAPRASGADSLLRGERLASLHAPGSGVPGPDAPGSFDATLPNGRRVTPAGISVQVGQDPLNSVLTPDGKYLITSNDDERGTAGQTGSSVDPADTKNGADTAVAEYSLGVTDTATMRLVAAIPVPTRLAKGNPGSTAGRRTDSDKTNGLWLGLAALTTPSGYTLYAAGGVADVLYKYSLGADGRPTAAPTQIPVPVPQDKTQATYGMSAPGWLTVSHDGRTLFVVNNNGNSVTPLDLTTDTPGTPMPVGYFPYAAEQFGTKLFVSNWGVTDRRFADGAGTTNATTGVVTHSGTRFVGGGSSNLFANPVTDPARSSSLSVLDLSGGTTNAVSLARPIDGVNIVGGTHPSALALVDRVDRGRTSRALYVADANEDRLAIVDPVTETVVRKFRLGDVPHLRRTLGLTPDALALSPDQRRLYVAEAGLNAVAVYDLRDVYEPEFLGFVPTGWYPTGVTLSPDGHSLFVTNAKGAGSPYAYRGTFTSPRVYTNPDVNFLFGSVQKVDLTHLNLSASTDQVVHNTVAVRHVDTGKLLTLQSQIQHIVFILRENKSYDTYLGDDATLNARGANGDPAYAQYGPYVPNLKAVAEQFAIGDSVYADSEESNAGHSFALAGTSTDYQQKTMLSRGNRPLVNVKNQDPEDYPLRGYIFNALARNGRPFRDYGDGIRISGYDEGNSGNFCADDPKPNCVNSTYNNIADKTSPITSLGGLYSETLPALQVLKGNLDETYPGWNLRISDQRRAAEFIRDYGAQVAGGTTPDLAYVWLPDDHTGTCSSNTTACSGPQEVADSDAAFGQIIDYLTHAPTWAHTAVFVTEDDAQSSPDHVSAHRTYTTVISPWAAHHAVIHRPGSTVSVPKTIEELMDLPPMNLGDLMANDLLDYFTTTPDYTPYVTSTPAPQQMTPAAPPEAQRIWDLTGRLDTAEYDADTAKIGSLTNLFFQSMRLADQRPTLTARAYAAEQQRLYLRARAVVARA